MSAYPFTFEIRNAALGSVWRVRDVAGVVGFDPLELAGELVAWIEAGDGKQERAARLEAFRLLGRHPAGVLAKPGRFVAAATPLAAFILDGPRRDPECPEPA